MTDTAPARPLVLTEDPVLLDEVLRLAAAAGVVADVRDSAEGARGAWQRAPFVVVGRDLADTVAALVDTGALPRRAAVALVTLDLDDATVWRRAVATGAEHVVCLPDGEEWLVDHLGRTSEGPGRGGDVIACVAGRGGAGATVLSVGLAMSGLRRGLRTMLVDADPLGGGIDLAVGAEDADGARWSALSGAHGRIPAGDLRAALPAVGELTVLSWDRTDLAAVPVGAMHSLLGAARSGSDLVVVDLPRQADEAARAVLAEASTTYLVVPAEVRACSAASRVARSVLADCDDVRVVVRVPGPGRLDPRLVGESLGLPVAGVLRPEPRLAEVLERGEPPGRVGGPLARLCDRLLDDLGVASEAA